MSSRAVHRQHRAYEQGAGLIDVGARTTCCAPTSSRSTSPPRWRSTRCCPGSSRRPGVGVGIYDREGVDRRHSYTRTYTFTRTSGGSKTITYDLTWVGNDGTFSAQPSVSLPLNKPVTVAVQVNPAAPGAHSAVLRLDDPANAGIDRQTLNTVVAPYSSAAANTRCTTGKVGRNQSLHYFFRVPAGTPALKVDFAGPPATAGTGQARFLRYHPYGVAIDNNASNSCYAPTAGGLRHRFTEQPDDLRPAAGVWEVTVDGRRTSDAAWTPFTLTASVLGATVTPNPDVIATATAGVPVARSYTLTSTLGSFTGRAVGGGSLGSARQGPTIANHENKEYDLTVTRVRPSCGRPSAAPPTRRADLDLYVSTARPGPAWRPDSRRTVTPRSR